MSNRTQRRKAAHRKAFQVTPAITCFEPDKVRYEKLWAARRSAKAQGLRPYPCGDHYHLTSRP